MKTEKSLIKRIREVNIVIRIIVGIILGVTLAVVAPGVASYAAILGNLFVGGLKAIAPILVFVLVISSIANQAKGTKTHMRPIITLYVIGTVLAAFTAVAMSFAFPVTLELGEAAQQAATAPKGILSVIETLLYNMVDNPVNALRTGNFIGILVWAIAFGLTFQHGSDATKKVLADISDAVAMLVKFIISMAPLGIFGLVAGIFAETGFAAFQSYMHLIGILIGSMLIVALIINPIIVYIKIRRNPYPLVFKCLRESGITAFFTRSSAANIPVNMELCKNLDLHEDTYSVSIPLGATINMAGAAVTITVLTLAAANTLGIDVGFGRAFILSILAAASACGASGVAGGSLLLIPLACSLFDINIDIAMQVVAAGFVVSVIQDSAETGLNSSTDVLFTAAACIAEENKEALEA